MGSDFRDVNNDGLPDIWHTAVEHQTFPLYLNQGKRQFLDATATSGLAQLTNHRECAKLWGRLVSGDEMDNQAGI
jgi:hypothetical protein